MVRSRMSDREVRRDAPPTAESAAATFTDVLLVREAFRARARGIQPDPLAGLRIEDAEVDRLIQELTGRAPEGKDKQLTSLDEAVERAREQLFAAMATSPTLLPGIARAVRLEPAEIELLSFLVSVEFEPDRQRLLAYVQDDVTKTRPTIATVRRLFGAAGLLAVASAGKLRRAALITVDESVAWGAQPVTLCGPVTWAIAGDGSPDPDLPLDAVTYDVDADGGAERLVLVSGPDRVRRLEAAFETTAGRRFLVTSPPTTPVAWEAVIREATVAGLAVVLELGESMSSEVRWWIERADHLAWAVLTKIELPLEELPRRPWVERHAEGGEVTAEEWAAQLGDVPRKGHRLTADQLRLVATARAGLDGDVVAAVRRLASGHLDQHARRIRPRKRWDDLVLAPDKTAQLREMVSRYQHRDRVHGDWGFPAFPSSGLVAMFSGPSGTGKTLAAEIVAGELGLDLYKLDLSAVVSKYIGETEQNLERVFNAASAGNLVLFFDEADSLFGKRSEVTDARDRYANIEVSYLLQRLESYDGLVVMATNFQKNIDDAFLRRIHVAIEFSVPEEAERKRIWQQGFPPNAPVGDMDWDFLARQFKLAGGAIKNAALHAGFLAAEAGTDITMETVMLGLKREFQKLGRLRTAADFGIYAELVNS